MSLVLSGCGKSLNAIVGSTSTTEDPVTANGANPATTPIPAGEVAVAFPVTDCAAASGTALPSGGWKPSVLLAPISTAMVGKVEFYTDGTHTLLGPYGWNCSEWSAVPGFTGLVVYPPNTTPPAVNTTPAAGTEGVFASFGTTGSTQGVALVCRYFTVAQFQQQQASCSGPGLAGEQSTLVTPDVAALTDPAGVTGALQGSGGSQPVTGVVIFPQVLPAVTYGTAVAIATESCSLVAARLCPTIISDFEVREFPVPNSGSRDTDRADHALRGTPPGGTGHDGAGHHPCHHTGTGHNGAGHHPCHHTGTGHNGAGRALSHHRFSSLRGGVRTRSAPVSR